VSSPRAYWAPFCFSCMAFNNCQLQYSCSNWYDLLRKKAYQLGIISSFSSVLSRIFFENLTKHRKLYQLGAYQLAHKTLITFCDVFGIFSKKYGHEYCVIHFLLILLFLYGLFPQQLSATAFVAFIGSDSFSFPLNPSFPSVVFISRIFLWSARFWQGSRFPLTCKIVITEKMWKS